ncbi:MAG: type II toxin-antitoxin system Phd/YefM family antitoxin [Tepidiformaceae bacterium]
MTRNEETWQLQDAKNRLSEVVRRAESGAEQVITVRGKPVAVVISYEDHRRSKQRRTGRDLRRLMQQCPVPEIFDFIPERTAEPMREIEW